MIDYRHIESVVRSIDNLNRAMDRIADALEKLVVPASPVIPQGDALEKMRGVFADAGFNLPPKGVKPCAPPWDRRPSDISDILTCDHQWRGPLYVRDKAIAVCIQCKEARIIESDEIAAIDEESTIYDRAEALKLLQGNHAFLAIM